MIHEGEINVERPAHLGTGQWKLQALNHITVLFGRNGSGKSFLLRNLLNQDQASRHLATPERGGELNFEASWATQELIGSGRASSRQSNFSADFRGRAISRIQTVYTARGFDDNRTSDTSRADIEHLMRGLLPEFGFKLVKEQPFFEMLRPNGDRITQQNQLSSGEVGLLTMGIDILTVCSLWRLENREKRILLIDEPDTHLHPDLQQNLASFVVDVMKRYECQIIVATHSTTLLSALGFYGGADTSTIYLTNEGDALSAIPFNEGFQILSACLGGHALMGPLFSVPLLLVEGDDDYRVWSQVPRHKIAQLSVIPCDGAAKVKTYQKALEKILSSLRTIVQPAGYALLDGDQALPTAVTSPQAQVPFLKLECRETENLYLTDEVLSELGTDWEQAKTKIKASAASYGSKAVRLLTCDSWDRKGDDIKGVINEIAEILDEKHVHWTRRVGDCLGKSRPSGQIRVFVGDTIVNALWPVIAVTEEISASDSSTSAEHS
jgi:predicted ATPase